MTASTAATDAKRTVSSSAFTLIELLVVVTIIVVLLALLVPAMDKAIEQAERATCASRLDAIGSGAAVYAVNNRYDYFICRARAVPLAFDALGTYTAGTDWNRPEDPKVDWLKAMSTVGLASSSPQPMTGSVNPQHRPTDAWMCPSIKVEPRAYSTQYGSIGVGYQYLGGIAWWRTPFGTRNASRSPIKLSKSGPAWVLAADSTYRVNGAWNLGGMTAHHSPQGSHPYGGNQVFTDGSVAWHDFHQMVFVHTWSADFNRDLFFHQRDLGGYNPPEQAYGSDPSWD